MTAEDGAIGKIVGIICRSRSQRGGQDKAMVDIDPPSAESFDYTRLSNSVYL